MKKEYNGAKVEKVEFNYEENVVASHSNPSCWCGHWEGNNEKWNNNGTKCINPCKWIKD